MYYKWFVCLAIISSIYAFQVRDYPKNAAQLGEKLFNDPILSLDTSISCASCHIPAQAFSDTVAFSKGVSGKVGNRNAPALTNMANRELFFWDGRANSLEQQVLFPIANADEMNLPIAQAILRLQTSNYYKKVFKKVFKNAPTSENLALAIAAYERTLESSSSPFDRYMNSEDTSHYSSAAERGRKLFMGKAKCFDCHFSPDFTGNEFRNIGLYNAQEWHDKGRYAITYKKEDIGKFKVPSLRNAAITAPYMHNGSFTTLAQVIEYYNNPSTKIHNSINRDSILQKPLGLTSQEKKEIELFLHTLTDDNYRK